MTLTGRRACVLLSGGMDSTACFHWAMANYRDVRAVGFDYGQPQRDAELVPAGRLARRHGIPFEIIALADTLHSGILAGVPKHESTPTTAIHRAFVPGRNLVFLSIALSRAFQWWPEGKELDIVVGCVREDTTGFPDCTEHFIASAETALSAAVDAKVRVAAPYVRMTKAEMLADVARRFQGGIADIQESWSCYDGKGPCGVCTACALRAQALLGAGLTDLCALPQMSGGDVARGRGLG
jgi:7-cyano-7-deazaguanine synthase